MTDDNFIYTQNTERHCLNNQIIVGKKSLEGGFNFRNRYAKN